MKTLLIDNYDSYTYNLSQLIAEVNGEEPVVVLNDAVDAIPHLGEYLAEFDNVVVSPGPGHPAEPRDFGLSTAVIAESPIPVLGVCLGHQGIALGESGLVGPAPEPRHGHLSAVRHDGRDLFRGLPQGFTAVRYHSLAVSEPLPETLEATAWSEDGVLMGLRHRSRPLWGVQFHPESVLTDYGHRMLVNFRNLTAERARKPRAKNTAVPAPDAVLPRSASIIPRPRRTAPAYRLHSRRIAGAVDTEAAFTRMYAGSPRAFWLDSALVEEGRARFSFFGDDSGPLAEFVRYDVDSGRCEIERAGRPTRKVAASVFDYLGRQLTSRRVDGSGLPFDFTGGYVGYFGYEMKGDCGSPNRHSSEVPDACWLFADRLIAVDHLRRFTYAVCLAEDTPQAAREAEDWLESALAQLTFIATEPTEPGEATEPTAPTDRALAPASVPSPDLAAAEPWLVRDRAAYLADIEVCQQELRSGTSYEICLTNAARLPAPPDPYAFYRVLRRVNPAPYAAFLRFGDVDVAGSSPERFLRISRDGVAEARPIKGTAPRGADPAEDTRLRDALAADAKTRAENLMIVDLLRNDLGRVSRTGSVRVTRLMATETYATVHQLVSTVEGRLRDGVDAVDCVQACFPGGSMTGAPKLRTMEIIDSLETEARGVYSGALGYLGCGGGADLNIVIRTAVFADGLMHLGAGGAIVLDSDPVAEYDEMLLKTAAQMRALHLHTSERTAEQREQAAVRGGRTASEEPVR
ncbi:aminodeoxychorismate synthase component I [Streptomyces griseorubiginosus]|uniref:aminodeoxychorismate synthase component I n=1 Tax=Streptomyces griseorubiginosus TaxID=67304 RepID=UPI002E803AD9|nr:aminodeoxychorismate synthase component I [Streptomyces griseorubiginosus]WUB44807.1 aminodeoxychorismate synthase component I [Streptomyces griseorubiginosus]WUB53324.1 aminodeoxychorismate synthase component I [Streptomyces griseorubiginosus]